MNIPAFVNQHRYTIKWLKENQENILHKETYFVKGFVTKEAAQEALNQLCRNPTFCSGEILTELQKPSPH